jgi:4-hydroxy-tetrahydrodipicolinate reductase
MAEAGVEVAVDFTVAAAARANALWCADNGVHSVIGTTGFSPGVLAEIKARFEAGVANCVVAPNFAIGAVLMMRFAELAAPFFETVEIVELHHDGKVDAPSGTAVLTAQRISEALKDQTGGPVTAGGTEAARGTEAAPGVRVHSVRLRGLVAHQEVLFGTTGQTLTIRHDSMDRSSFMPGVLLAVKQVQQRRGLTVGLDALLGF